MSMQKSLFTASTILVLMFSYQVCAEFKELDKLKDQPETAQQSYSVGDTVKWLKNDSPSEQKVIGVASDATQWLWSDGCKEKFPNAGFTVPIEWSGCGVFGTGTAKVNYKSEPWPLSQGKKWNLNIQGNGWQLNRSCKVNKAVKIKINLGEFDTYKVQCSDASNRLVWYIDVNTGQTMYFTHTNSYYKTNTKLEAAELIN